VRESYVSALGDARVSLRVSDWQNKSLRTPVASEDMPQGLGVYSGHPEKQARNSDEESLEQERDQLNPYECWAIVKRPVLG